MCAIGKIIFHKSPAVFQKLQLRFSSVEMKILFGTSRIEPIAPGCNTGVSVMMVAYPQNGSNNRWNFNQNLHRKFCRVKLNEIIIFFL